jgi:hypothetical protein
MNKKRQILSNKLHRAGSKYIVNVQVNIMYDSGKMQRVPTVPTFVPVTP